MPETGPTRSIEFESALRSSPAAVWHALTAADEIARWLAPEAKGGHALGEKLTMSWGPGVEWHTTVTGWEPEQRVQWIDDPEAHRAAQLGRAGSAPQLAIDWHLVARGGGTALTMVHSGFGSSREWDERYDATEAGWRYFLFNLRHYLERHAGTPRRIVSARRAARERREETWNRLFGPTGLGLDRETSSDLWSGALVTIRIGDSSPMLAIRHASPPTHAWGVIRDLNDALLYVELEPGKERYHCGIWLSTYGLDDQRVNALQRGVDSLADRVFGPEV
ncbi:MAG TPA: SRPBCC domain-containing protein [Gemmatimonadaceae bacterium]|nr:SRPBCC domain-containing protein [Gemmatimonadaceae bacterium]